MAIPLKQAIQASYKDISELSSLGASTLNKQTFTSNGTFTVPTGFKGILFVTCCGGGGGGSTANSGGGGGGGEVYFRWPVRIDQSVTSSVSVTVGTGGSAGAAGSATSFGSYFSAGGGSAGSGTAGGAGGGSSDSFYAYYPMYRTDFTAHRNVRVAYHCGGGSGGTGGSSNTENRACGAFHYNTTSGDRTEGSSSGEGNSMLLMSGAHPYALEMGELGFAKDAWCGVSNSAVYSSGCGLGGNSLSAGGNNAANTPTANGGGGGLGRGTSGTPSATGGANGILYVEWWS